MRVVYLADAPYVHTRRWVEHFARLGWEAHVLSFRPAEIEGARVHHVDGFEGIGRARYLAHARRVRRLVRELRPDLVHAMHLTSYGFLAAFAGVRPLISSVWGTDILEAPRWSPLHLALTKYALSRADHITATGLRLASATLRYTPPSTPVTVVPFGVDIERFRPVARNGSRPDEVVVGAVARLSLEKGLDSLLDAVAKLSASGLPLRVVLAGEGPRRIALQSQATRLRIADRVEFRGAVPHEAVPAVLAELDIFVMPSRAEGFGVAALEAQAMGLPVVASRVHGIPDVVVHGKTGLLVPPGDAAALAGAIERLARDTALRTEMGRAGRRFVGERYRWQDNAAQMERLYGDLLAFAQPGRRATVPESQDGPTLTADA
jgi:glycosyltransferase involved in cell wall biosynthesis